MCLRCSNIAKLRRREFLKRIFECLSTPMAHDFLVPTKNLFFIFATLPVSRGLDSLTVKMFIKTLVFVSSSLMNMNARQPQTLLCFLSK